MKSTPVVKGLIYEVNGLYIAARGPVEALLAYIRMVQGGFSPL